MILVAGIGNIFKGDDAFGVEVARALEARVDTRCVQVVDFGIRGRELAYTLLEAKHDFVVLVDVVQRGRAPGTIYLIDPAVEGEAGAPDGHGMHPAQALRWVRAMGGTLPRMRLVGCEPAALAEDDELSMGLSEPVRGAVARAVQTVEQLIASEETAP